MAPSTEDSARFYDALSRGHIERGLWGVESRFDAAKIIESPSVDRHFRKVVKPFIRARDRVLDVGCGPGGFTSVLAELSENVVGLDVSPAWVDAATRAFAERGLGRARAVLGSGSALPFPDASFDVVLSQFGHMFAPRPEVALKEMLRVLKPGGVAAILEFSQPKNALFAHAYDWFSAVLLPRIGGLISGSRQAYSYLPESIRKFPGAQVLAGRMREAGFSRVEVELMTFGAVALHLGWK